MKQTKVLTHATHVNGWFPAVYLSCMSQNFRLLNVSNLSVRNFRIFLLMYTGSPAVWVMGEVVMVTHICPTQSAEADAVRNFPGYLTVQRLVKSADVQILTTDDR